MLNPEWTLKDGSALFFDEKPAVIFDNFAYYSSFFLNKKQKFYRIDGTIVELLEVKSALSLHMHNYLEGNLGFKWGNGNIVELAYWVEGVISLENPKPLKTKLLDTGLFNYLRVS